MARWLVRENEDEVRHLLRFLQALEEPLRSAGETKVANELVEVCKGLQLFGDLPLGQFAEFLRAADHYRKTGKVPVAPTKARSKAKVVDTEKVRAGAAAVNSLYERATDSDVDYSSIERELNGLKKDLSKDEAVALAREVNIAKPRKTKKGAFEAIQARIFDRTQSFERTQF